MSAIVTSADGDFVFLALENSSAQPVIVKASRGDLAAWSAAYNPGAGTAGNVAASGDPDVVFFYGNFGSGVQVVKHTVSGPTNTNISPAGLAAKVVNCLAVNPSNADEIIITVSTDQDLLYTDDGGDNWTVLDAALGFDPTALAVVWGGSGEPHTIYVAGNDGIDTLLLFSPNEGDTFADVAGASLAAAANVVGIDAT